MTADVDLLDPAPLSTTDRNGVRRSKDGRPYVKGPCPNAETITVRIGGESEEDRRDAVWANAPKTCFDGRVPGKRAGTTKKCPSCKGEGFKELLYTRCTTFVGALEERDQLERWKVRTALLGLAADDRAEVFGTGDLMLRLLAIDPDDPESRKMLDLLADEAFEAGDGYVKAHKGTSLHELTERLDAGEPLGDITVEDRLDLGAYVSACREYGIEMLDAEVFVVEDGLRIGGTYDRRVKSLDPRLVCAYCDDVDDNLGPQRPVPKVLDLKTGRVDYGGGKMRQQLAVYANSRDYDPETGERSDQDVCPHKGIILHLPQGQGRAELFTVDLVQGWRDVQLSAAVREHRRTSRDALVSVSGGVAFAFDE